MLEQITGFLTPSHSKVVLTVLRTAFFITGFFFVFKIAKQHTLKNKKNYRRLKLFPLCFAVGLLSILAYQTTWQLAGFVRKDFVRFMERYNPRHDNAAAHIVRGSIVDRAGRILAQTDISSETFRSYPYAEATAHIVGFRHPVEGLTGMENATDAILSGYWDKKEGKFDFRKTAQTVLKEQRQVGTNVVLTIDADLQMAAYSQLAGRKGAVVAIDPRNGAIRLLVSSPSFDPNNYDRLLTIDPESPLLNRALHGRYPAGSTFKIAIAGLLVERGINEHINCPANGYRAPGAHRPVRDHEYYSWKKRGRTWPGFGTIGLDTALAKSANSYFAHAGVLCGTAAFNTLSDRLLFNARIPLFVSPIGRVTSQKGSLPHLGKGERRELSQLSIGQGRMTATPLHVAMLTAAIAHDGRLFRPRILEDAPPVEMPRVFSTATARRVHRAMRAVITSGTGRRADIDGLTVCGKTGTAQNPGGDDHAWFVCFAPQKNAEIAIAVLVENAGYGSAEALPIATEILVRHFNNEAQRKQEAR